MILTVGSDLRLPLAALPASTLDALKALAARPNPRWAKENKRLDYAPYGIAQHIEMWAVEGDSLVLPRGLVLDALRLLRGAGIAWTVDRQVAHGEPLAVEFGGELRDYQVEPVEAMVRRRQGLVVAPCGSGKTVLALAAIARAGRSALILVHTKDLAAQWRTQVQRFLGVEAGIIGGGKRKLSAITVALTQTLTRWTPEALVELGARFGVLVVDECHSVPTRMTSGVVAHLACRYRWGLTATPDREDGLGFVLGWILGPEIARFSQPELIAQGHLMAAEIRTVRTAFAWGGDATEDFAGLIAALVEDEARNELVVDVVCRELEADGTVLVLSQRKAHCDVLAALIVAQGFDAVALTSARTAKARTKALDDLRSGDLRCVVATQLADEGLDVPRLTAVVLATPQRAKGRTEQRLGRTMRPAPGKPTPVLYDIVDGLVGVLQNQAWARQRAYRKVLGPRRVCRPATRAGQRSLPA